MKTPGHITRKNPSPTKFDTGIYVTESIQPLEIEIVCIASQSAELAFHYPTNHIKGLSVPFYTHELRQLAEFCTKLADQLEK